MASGTAAAASLTGSSARDRLKQAKMIQCCKILFHKLSKSLTPTFEKQIIPEMNKMNDDGTRLLYHILKVTMSTTATASKVALEQLIDLSLKNHGWDIDKMHTLFDQLIATLKAAKEEQSTGTQLLYLMKAYKTNPENDEWMAHVRNMDSMINSDQINDVQALQNNAKRYYTTLINDTRMMIITNIYMYFSQRLNLFAFNLVCDSNTLPKAQAYKYQGLLCSVGPMYKSINIKDNWSDDSVPPLPTWLLPSQMQRVYLHEDYADEEPGIKPINYKYDTYDYHRI